MRGLRGLRGLLGMCGMCGMRRRRGMHGMHGMQGLLILMVTRCGPRLLRGTPRSRYRPWRLRPRGPRFPGPSQGPRGWRCHLEEDEKKRSKTALRERWTHYISKGDLIRGPRDNSWSNTTKHPNILATDRCDWRDWLFWWSGGSDVLDAMPCFSCRSLAKKEKEKEAALRRKAPSIR